MLYLIKGLFFHPSVKPEKSHIRSCDLVEGVFEALKGTNSTRFDASRIFVNLPNLRQVDLEWLPFLRYISKSKIDII